MRAARFASFVLLAAGPAFAGNLYVVDKAMGPGATHAWIGAALEVAQDGDAILVRAGEYIEYPLIDDLAVTLTAEKGATVRVLGVTVRNTSSARPVVISGLSSFVGFSQHATSLLVQDCQGPVWVQDCALVDAIGSFDAPVAATVRNCSAVAFQRCILASATDDDTVVRAGLDAENSSVYLLDSQVVGATGTLGIEGFLVPGGHGHPGVRLRGGSLFVEGGAIRGGSGGSVAGTGVICVAAGNGGAGLVLESGAPSAVLFDAAVHGGAGGVAPGPCADGVPGPATSVPSGSIATLPGSARALSVPQPIREGETTAIALDGQPGDLAWILVSAAQNPHAPWFGTGVLLVAEPFQIVFAGVTDAAGHKAVPVTLGEIGVTYASVFLQGVFFSPTEDFPHSSGAMALLLDAAVL